MARIAAATTEELDQWIDNVLDAQSLAEVINDRGAHRHPRAGGIHLDRATGSTGSDGVHQLDHQPSPPSRLAG